MSGLAAPLSLAAVKGFRMIQLFAGSPVYSSLQSNRASAGELKALAPLVTLAGFTPADPELAGSRKAESRPTANAFTN